MARIYVEHTTRIGRKIRESHVVTSIGDILKKEMPELWSKSRRQAYLDAKAKEKKDHEIRDAYKQDARDRRKTRKGS